MHQKLTVKSELEPNLAPSILVTGTAEGSCDEIGPCGISVNSVFAQIASRLL